MFSRAGTTGLTENYNGLGVMPIRNFQEGFLPEIGPLSAREFLRRFSKKTKSCFNCRIQCSHYYAAGEDCQEEGL
jgi:aldehyde:ferredoxin oxidoreductase